MSGAIYDQLGEAMKSQRERFGADAFANRRRVISLLADALPEARREIRAVASALDDGAVEALTGVERRLLGMEMDRQADRLEQSVGLRPDLARQIIRALAYALELGPAPSVYEAAPATTPPPAQDWAGISQPVTGAHASQSAHAASHGISPGVSHGPSPGGSSFPAQPAQPSAGWLNAVLFNVQGRAVTGMHAAIAGAAIGLAVVVLPMLSGGGGGGQTIQTNQAQDYAGELHDVGVQPKDTLESNVGSPTPMSVPGGQRVTTLQVRELVNTNRNLVLIDVLVDQHQATIQNARYVPAAGQPGSFNDNAQVQTARALQTLTGGRRDTPLVFFCAGSACWESYNAVLRARSAGYTQLYWYRGGLASWSEARLPMQALPAPSN